MPTSKTFTTPYGNKATTRANRRYIVIVETVYATPAGDGRIRVTGAGDCARVVLRTDNLETAKRRMRKDSRYVGGSLAHRDGGVLPYDLAYVFDKSTGRQIV